MSKLPVKALIILVSFLGSAPNVRAQNQPNAANVTVDEAVREAIDANPEAQAARAAAKGRQLQSRIAFSPFLPQLAIEGGTRSVKSPLIEDSGNFLLGVARINLYNGGRDWNEREAALTEASVAQERVRLVEDRVARETIRHYADVMLFDQTLTLKREALTTNAEQMKLARRKASGGVTSDADVLEFEFRENALKTEVTLLQHERSTASRALNVVMGSDQDRALTTSGNFETLSVEKSLGGRSTAESYIQSQALLEPKAALRIAEIRSKSAAAVWLPRADLEGRYGDQRYSDPGVIGNPSWRIDLKLTLPLFNGTETLYARQAATELEREATAKMRAANLETQSVLKDRNEKIQVLQELLRLQKENINRAEKYYSATLAEYRRGIKNSPDLSSATERFFDARIRGLELRRDLLVAQMGLMNALSSRLP